jgi:hypothetical protein
LVISILLVGLAVFLRAVRPGAGCTGRAEEESEETENCHGPFRADLPELVNVLSVEGGIGDGGVVAATDFGDEAAELAVVRVLFDAGVGFGVVCLEPEEFVSGFLGDGARCGDFFAAAAPEFEGVVAGDEESLIIGANCGSEREFRAHTFLLMWWESK